MAFHLGDIAPNFVQKSTAGDIDFHAWLGTSWGLLFSHPKDFTPVCTTELGVTAKLKEEFARRSVKVLAVSVDALDSHSLWVYDINETQNAKRKTQKSIFRCWLIRITPSQTSTT